MAEVEQQETKSTSQLTSLEASEQNSYVGVVSTPLVDALRSYFASQECVI